MEDVLKAIGESRKQALALSHVEYGGHLVKQLYAHSQQMEKIYSCFQGLSSQPDIKDAKFLKIMKLANEKIAWFEKAKARSHGHKTCDISYIHVFVKKIYIYIFKNIQEIYDIDV